MRLWTIYQCSHSACLFLTNTVLYLERNIDTAVCSNSEVSICGFAAWYIVILLLLFLNLYVMEPEVNDNQTTMANPSLPTDPPSAFNEPPSYPPYNLEHVVSYTDQQILHYIRTNQIPDRQAFLRAKQERDEFLHQVGITVGSDGKPTQFISVSIPAPVLPTSTST